MRLTLGVVSRFPHQPLQFLRLFIRNNLLELVHRQEIVIRELEAGYHRLRSRVSQTHAVTNDG